MKFSMKWAALAVVCAGLGACASPVERQYTATTHAAEKSIAAYDKKPVAEPVVQVHSGTFLLGQALPAEFKEPAWLREPIVLNSAVPQDLAELAAQITQLSGVQIQVDPSVANDEKDAKTAGKVQGALAPLNNRFIPLKQREQQAAQEMAQAREISLDSLSKTQPVTPTTRIVVSYSGTLRGLLDRLVSQYQVYWKPLGNSVLIFRQETKSFVVPAIPMKMQSKASITTTSNSSGGSGGASGGSGSTSGATGSGSINEQDSISVDPWESVEKTAAAIAGANAKVVIDKTNDLLTVTATPPQLDHVASWVKSLQSTMSKSVLIDVEIYDIQSNKEDQFAFNPSLLFQNLGQKYGFTLSGLAGPATSLTSALSLGGYVISPSTAPTVQTNPTFGTGGPYPATGFTGSSAVIQALAAMKGVTRVLSRAAVTVNGVPATIQSATQQGYLASTTVTTLSSTTTTTQAAMTPGSVTTGFTAVITPRVIGNSILLGMNMTLSNLLNLQTETNGQQQIQVPTVATQGISQVASLKPGQTLLLTGLAQTNDQKAQNGVGTPGFQVLGGGTDSQSNKDHLVILVTASLVGGAHAQ